MSKMTATISSPPFNNARATRPPSFPSESTIPAHRRTKTRDVPSRYLEASSFFRSPSPSRNQSPTNRPASPFVTDGSGRRQSATPRRGSLERRDSGEVSAAERMLLASSSSGRGLFSSFQEESKRDSSPSATIEKRKKISTSTPRSEKSKVCEQWPRSLKPSCLSRSLDFTDTRQKKLGGSSNSVARALHNSFISNRTDSSADSSCSDLEQVDSVISDTESVSSESINGRGNRLLARGIVVKARFLQPASNRSLEPGSPSAKFSSRLRTLESPKLIVVPKKMYVDSPALSPNGVSTARSQLFPKRPASPNKFGTHTPCSSPRGASIARGISPSRGMIPPSRGVSPSGRLSPLRARSSSSVSNNTPLMPSFAVDGRKEKALANAHLLRLSHNTIMQWRFANARANVVLSAQKKRAERSLYNAWISIAKLYDSVTKKRIEMQHLKQNLKLISILDRQMVLLEEWIIMEHDHTRSLVGAADALKGSTLCLPVGCGAMVQNVQSVKDAICSAVDVMQAMASSICLLLPKVGKISSLASELARVNVKERRMLEICRDLLNTISSLEVRECSLRTQVLQLHVIGKLV